MDKFHRVFTELMGQGTNISVPRIVIRMCDRNHSVAAVLSQLIFWSGKTSREDGWFYKTHDELAEEVELTPSRVKHYIKKLKVLFPGAIETSVRKAHGVPTTHFKIHFSILETLIYSVLADLPNPNGESAKLDRRDCQTHGSGEFAKSITDPNHIRSTDPIPQHTDKTEQARPSSTKPSLNEKQIVDVWNALGCARHRGITKNARKSIDKTYREYCKANEEPKPLDDWIVTYLRHGFGVWMSNHHRDMGDGKWCADLEFAMRFSTYDKVKNTELQL
ncbi:hypothetical protein [Enterovibrio norvegicus]|uniref:hypothetical protein n=1 Tax=Enterovibrio norvegicus TaxID=188144 RepID=UPI0024B0D17A|nr:hypothetical protein [Enterovibrio norvegicus]